MMTCTGAVCHNFWSRLEKDISKYFKCMSISCRDMSFLVYSLLQNQQWSNRKSHQIKFKATSSQSYEYTQLGFSPNWNCFCTKQTNLMASLCCMRRNWENQRIHPRSDSPFQDLLLASNLCTICTEILNIACTVTTACFSVCLCGSGRGLPALAPPPTSTPAPDPLVNLHTCHPSSSSTSSLKGRAPSPLLARS